MILEDISRHLLTKPLNLLSNARLKTSTFGVDFFKLKYCYNDLVPLCQKLGSIT